MTRNLKAVALAATMALTISGATIGAEYNTAPQTQLTVAPFIEIANLAAVLDWDGGTDVFGGDTLIANVSGTPGGGMGIQTNTAGGYTFALGISGLTGGTSAYVIDHTAHDVRLASVVTADPVTFGSLLPDVGTWANYAPVSGVPDTLNAFTCGAACSAGEGAESYEMELRLAVPLGAPAEDYTGVWTARVSTN